MSSIFPNKRTRSQLTLPDDILQVPQRSPLKDARIALRNQASLSPQDKHQLPSESDDEILLSPKKKAEPPSCISSKRSASPPPVQDAIRPDGSSQIRQFKRLKHDHGGSHTDASSDNDGIDSDGSQRAFLRKRSMTFTKPVSLGHTSPVKVSPPPTHKSRAQSVPLFPSSSTMTLVDLRNPPPSPGRVRSQSPSRQNLRIVSSPTRTGFGLEGKVLAEEKEAFSAPEASSSCASVEILSPSVEGDVLMQSVEPSVRDYPKTPLIRDKHLAVQPPLSPLTPLPETPYPSKFSNAREMPASFQSRLLPTSEENGLHESSKAEGSTSALSHSLISHCMTDVHSTSTVLSFKTELHSNQIASSSKQTLPSTQKDAFSILMSSAWRDKQEKPAVAGSKIKAKAMAPRAGLKTIRSGLSTKSKPGHVLGSTSTSSKLKSRMRPKVEIKSKPPEADTRTGRASAPKGVLAPPQEPPQVGSTCPSVPPVTEPPEHTVSIAVVASVSNREAAPETFGAFPNDVPPSISPGTTQGIAQEKVQEETQEEKEREERSSVGAMSKLPIPKRIPSTNPTGRVTRSASSQRRERTEKVPCTNVSQIVETGGRDAHNDLESNSSTSKPGISHPTTESNGQTGASSKSLPLHTPLGSPMKVDSSVRHSYAQPTRSSVAKAVQKTDNGTIIPRIPSSGSPSKLARAVSMFARPSEVTTVGSSLTTLASALQKLRRPPPGRPNTSMGFNREEKEGDTGNDIGIPNQTSDDSLLFMNSTANESRELDAVDHGSSHGSSSQSHAPELNNQQRRGSNAADLLSGRGMVTRGGMRGGISRHNGLRLFGNKSNGLGLMGRPRLIQKASRKTTLPSVMGSPVKGGCDRTDDAVEAGSDRVEGREEIGQSMEPPVTPDTVGDPVPSQTAGMANENLDRQWIFAAGRESQASQALSRSLNSLPSTANRSMGPPTTMIGVRTVSVSSTYPVSENSSEKPVKAHTRELRSSTIMSTMKSNAAAEALASQKQLNQIPDSMRVLKDCVVFVDVRTDDGDEAGSLFVEMLEGIGARILTRVGQTCTHVVFKNGLLSTLTRYRLLRDPKPFVVGIAWVVECVEKRARMDESKYLVDLEAISLAGGQKRRRSMLPKMVAHPLDAPEESSDLEHSVDGDQSLDGSSSSIIIDDGLTPLERARRRKAVLAS